MMKQLEIAPYYGKWMLTHNHQPLASFDTEAEAERAAEAIGRTQPEGDAVELVVFDPPPERRAA